MASLSTSERGTHVKLIRKTIFLFLSLAIITFGVAFSIRGNLGISPISSIPYVLSLITPLTVGTASMLVNGSLILLQVLVLRKDFRPYQLLQIPMVVVFGWLQDLALWATRGMGYQTYLQQWLLCLLGVVTLGIGVAGEIVVAVMTMPAEGLNLAICSKYPVKPGNVKIAIDCSLVAGAILISLLFLHRLEGVREGTIAAAVLVGTVVKLVMKPVQAAERAFTGDGQGEADT